MAVAPHVMQAASDTQTPQGILAVLPIPEWEFPADPTFLLIPDGVRDPGNLGTLLRTALAAGVEAVILPPGGADAFSPKVVRAGMGAHFRLPILSMDWENHPVTIGGFIHFPGRFRRWATPLPRPSLKHRWHSSSAARQPERGIRHLNLATNHIHIPMPGKTESLNAAIAGAILMFEVVRQRG